MANDDYGMSLHDKSIPLLYFLDTVLEALKTEKFMHSGMAQVTRSDPCMQISAVGVTIEKGISKLFHKYV